MSFKIRKNILLSLIFLSMFSVVSADVTGELIKEYQAKGAISASTERGSILWNKDINRRSCTTCHTTSTKNEGKHKRTGKLLKPMSPSVNPKRLANKKKVKKWLLRNCKWTFRRECTVQEKSDILFWLSQQ